MLLLNIGLISGVIYLLLTADVKQRIKKKTSLTMNLTVIIVHKLYYTPDISNIDAWDSATHV